ncbi:MAG TPA: cyclic nucleotide-binding protein, partial [Gammaproteobacteria bacterium]
MEVELLEIRDFLAAHHPFDQLPDQTLATLAGKITIRYFRRDEVLLEPGAEAEGLYMVRSGAVAVHSAD